jgi:hypothetical protein
MTRTEDRIRAARRIRALLYLVAGGILISEGVGRIIDRMERNNDHE